ncbi:hypothetical protein FA95DRAFT_1486048 [Auriscalpium vulgare]|uniref:Uncharacterized protein n=1 Tax=Auriscalpium vulgare TaxID=40419 RepID=A0ACB8S430_9AGAM|nr:hypothetical protein FA95DRAFT_1486048 [Auriscalpium vulgare]
MSNVTISPDDLPNSLRLPPHLSAHKYFFVCTLTVAAWDSLVLSPRSWKLLRQEGWPALKILFMFLRFFMPAEFIIVGVAFFDSDWSRSMCTSFYLFEPICTAILLAACSAVHVIRIHAIYDKSRTLLFALGGLLGFQVVVTAIACAFYRAVPLLDGQGCIAGPKHSWVGIYWASATLLYTTTFVLALMRSVQSLQVKSLSLWKMMLRDGLNLYGAIFIVNFINMLFWFIAKPTDNADSIKTIVTSMTAVITTTMTLRIILSVRGTLYSGGSFAGVWSSTTGTNSASRAVTSARAPAGAPSVLQINSQLHGAPTYTIDGMDGKAEHGWDGSDHKETLPHDLKQSSTLTSDYEVPAPGLGVMVTVDREVMDFDPAGKN